MEVVEITENCFNFVMSMIGNYYKNCCIYDCHDKIIAFSDFDGSSVKYYGLIRK